MARTKGMRHLHQAAKKQVGLRQRALRKVAGLKAAVANMESTSKATTNAPKTTNAATMNAIKTTTANKTTNSTTTKATAAKATTQTESTKSVFRDITTLVRTATAKHQKEVPRHVLDELVVIAKQKPEHVRHIFRLLMERLACTHSNTRLLCLVPLNLFVTRCKLFRTLAVADLQSIFDLTLGTEDVALPKPERHHPALQKQALFMFDVWHTRFGSKHPHLKRGLRYLLETRKMEIPSIEQVKELIAATEEAPPRKPRQKGPMTRLQRITRAALPLAEDDRRHPFPINSFLGTWYDADHHSW